MLKPETTTDRRQANICWKRLDRMLLSVTHQRPFIGVGFQSNAGDIQPTGTVVSGYFWLRPPAPTKNFFNVNDYS